MSLEQSQQKTVTTSSGKTYTLSSLTINMMCELQQKFGKTEMAELLSKKPDFEMVRMIYYLRAKKNHPDITLEEAGEITALSIEKEETGERIDSSIKQV